MDLTRRSRASRLRRSLASLGVLAIIASTLSLAQTEESANAATEDVALPVPGSLSYFNWTVGAVDDEGNPLAIPFWPSVGDDMTSVIVGDSFGRSWRFTPGPGPYNDPLPSEVFIDVGPQCVPLSPEPATTAGGINSIQEQLSDCWSSSFDGNYGGGPSGIAVPMTTLGSMGETLVFDRWQSSGGTLGPCQSGDIGFESSAERQMRGLLAWEFVPAFKSWVSIGGGPAGPRDFTVAAHYVPLSPDTTAPRVAITSPSGCGIATDPQSNVTPYSMGSTVLADYGCQDPGRGVPATCVGTVPNGEPIDTSSEGVKSFTVTSTDDQGNTSSRTIEYVVGPAIPEVSVNDREVSEAGGDKDVVFTVTLSSSTSRTVSVDYATDGGTAEAGSDFLPVEGTLTFEPGEVEKQVSVRVLDDDVWEPNVETASLVLSNTVNATGAKLTGLLTISGDDDQEPTLVSFGGGTVVEGDSGVTPLRATATLSNPSYRDTFLFFVSMTSGTATVGEDFAATDVLQRPCTVPAGGLTCFVETNVFGDMIVEGDETVVIQGCIPANGGCASFIDGTPGIILNDDFDDATAPTITASVTALPNAAGWYSGPVTITYTCADEMGGSGLAVDACPADDVLTESGTSPARSVSDRSGNVSAPSNTISVRIDDVDPTIDASVDRAANESGWYRAPVVVDFTCADAGGSGVASCSPSATVGEGASQSMMGVVTDVAGNEASTEITGLNVDVTAPVVQWNGGPEPGVTYVADDVPSAPSCVSVDTLSGPDGCVVTGYSTAVGSHTMTATARDIAGNVTIETRSYEVTEREPTDPTDPTDPVVPDTGSPQPGVPGQIAVSSTELTPGGTVRVTASGFAPKEAVQFWLNSTPRLLANGVAGADGSVDRTLVIPADVEPGSHRIEIRGALSGSIFIAVEVSESQLASTGARDTALVSLAALVLLGAGLLLRRSASTRSRA